MTTPVAFFETIYQAFLETEKAIGRSIDRFYIINGDVIRLCFAGPALMPLITSALEHLETNSSSEPALTVCLWDYVSTQTPMPPPPWSGYHLHNPSQDTRTMYTPRGDVRGYRSDRVHTAFHMGADVLTMLDIERNLGIYWTRNAAHLPAYEARSPLRSILHWWLRRGGRQLVHAGAVGTTHGGVLLAGKSGAGKSTAALTCLNSDLLYVSDDYCLIAADPAPYVFNLYSAAKVNADNIDRVPHLKPAFRNADPNEIEKATFFVHRHYPEKVVSGFPVRFLLLPRVTGRLDTTLKPASPEAGLSALVLSTMAQLAGADQSTLQTLRRFANQVSCYHLELGTDLTQIPDVIRTLLTNDSVVI